MKIFIAGASGVIGQELIPLLVKNGHDVLGMTRTEAKKDIIESLGARAAVCDVYDTATLRKIVAEYGPDVIMNQLTDLPDDISRIPEMGAANSRIRREGTHNLLEAAADLEKFTFITQSVAWQIPGQGGEAVTEMERAVLAASGIVLRYGQLYGPGTYYEAKKPGEPRIDIKEAARITLKALTAPSGIYSITDRRNSLEPLQQ